jgi:uncharacterized protein YceH (UPF0502 family)
VKLAIRLSAVEADSVALRVVGCLVEKQRTTPDAYPLSLNALRAACNQTTNRDPVVSYDEPTIRGALDRLSRMGWVRLASGPGSRAVKYRHLLDDALGLGGDEISLLAVLMLRGPQTPGELNQRTERLHRFGSLAAVEETLEAMAARELVARQPRRPGQKEDRYAHLLGEDEPETAAPVEPGEWSRPEPARDDGLAELQAELEALRAEVAELRASLRELDERLGS